MWSVCSEASLETGGKQKTPSRYLRDKQNNLGVWLIGLFLCFFIVFKLTTYDLIQYNSSCILAFNFAELDFMISVLQSVKSECR